MVVGILGGGQLARMLALAGHPMGIRTIVLDPAGDACAAPVATHLHGAFDDRALLDRLADACDVVTYEFENVPLESLRCLSEKVAVYPPVSALKATQDRLEEKKLFRELGIETADFMAVSSQQELESAIGEIGVPSVLKTRRMGYDGKGQLILKEAADVAGAWERLGGVPAILEAFVPFDREVSDIAVRGHDGAIAAYSLSENVHGDGILKLATSKPRDPIKPLAVDYATRLLDHLGYVGVMTLEFFQLGDLLLANEFAPRVHNSGHWTIEGAETSQFENHLRAVTGLALGSTSPVGHSAMINCIGQIPPLAEVMKVTGAHMHDYAKEPRPGRKVGHITVRSSDPGYLKEVTADICDLQKSGCR
jgi:5-(carboxyamino)imidazole ribonucleotide synthase